MIKRREKRKIERKEKNNQARKRKKERKTKRWQVKLNEGLTNSSFIV